ncbi:unnamed protein product [Camellia sinensis]
MALNLRQRQNDNSLRDFLSLSHTHIFQISLSRSINLVLLTIKTGRGSSSSVLMVNFEGRGDEVGEENRAEGGDVQGHEVFRDNKCGFVS